jgi:hypothetical protein
VIKREESAEILGQGELLIAGQRGNPEQMVFCEACQGEEHGEPDKPNQPGQPGAACTAMKCVCAKHGAGVFRELGLRV